MKVSNERLPMILYISHTTPIAMRVSGFVEIIQSFKSLIVAADDSTKI